jgi:hypothetical protein
LCTESFWAIHAAGQYTQLVGHDIMIYSKLSNNQLCLDTYSDTRFYQYNFAALSGCDRNNVNQQWRVIGEPFPCMLRRACNTDMACDLMHTLLSMYSH